MDLLEFSRKSSKVEKMKILNKRAIVVCGDTHYGFEVDLGDRIIFAYKLEEMWYCQDCLSRAERKKIFEVLDFYVANDLQRVS